MLFKELNKLGLNIPYSSYSFKVYVLNFIRFSHLETDYIYVCVYTCCSEYLRFSDI